MNQVKRAAFRSMIHYIYVVLKHELLCWRLFAKRGALHNNSMHSGKVIPS